MCMPHMQTQVGVLTFDFPALGIVVLLSLVLMHSTRGSALVNTIMVAVLLAIILFVIGSGASRRTN